MAPENNLEEVIDGELHTMPLATKGHNWIIEPLHKMLLRQMARSGDCFKTTPTSAFPKYSSFIPRHEPTKAIAASISLTLHRPAPFHRKPCGKYPSISINSGKNSETHTGASH